MNEKEKDLDWYILILAGIVLFFAVMIMSGCETIHGFGMDLTKATDKYCEEPVFQHP